MRDHADHLANAEEEQARQRCGSEIWKARHRQRDARDGSSQQDSREKAGTDYHWAGSRA